jgi:hypothetical protein
VADATICGEVIFTTSLANVDEAAKAIGSFADGKPLIDVTNAIGPT